MAKHDVVTPIPGLFYRRPDPDSEPFVSEGDEVQAGDTIGLVEIMKNFQPVQSETAGRVVEFAVVDEDEVVAGQTVAVVDDGA
jgi:acetyl-CoA carboxylase biotin carboxyl carrier protein